jgi:hypothetical protein
MLGRIMSDPRLPVILSRIDFDLAEEVRARGCPFCGGRLHSARYPRKPRCARDLGPGWKRRFSFCCAAEGCRRRTTPQSVRFFGRRLYPAVVIVLFSALAQGVTVRRFRMLHSILGIDRRTLERWRRWWREIFPRTRFWGEARARLLPPVDWESLPRSLLVRFGKGRLEGIVSLLCFLAPCSAGALFCQRLPRESF